MEDGASSEHYDKDLNRTTTKASVTEAFTKLASTVISDSVCAELRVRRKRLSNNINKKVVTCELCSAKATVKADSDYGFRRQWSSLHANDCAVVTIGANMLCYCSGAINSSRLRETILK